MSKERKKVISVLIPAKGGVPVLFFKSFVALLNREPRNFDINICINSMSPLDNSRNTLVERALDQNPDYILFLDTDNILAANTIMGLVDSMEENNADIMSALYFEKSKPYFPVLRELRNDIFWRVDNVELNKVMRVDIVGMGCCIIKPSVFKKLKWPWFKYNYEKQGYKTTQIGEDIFFCRNVIKAGMKIFCNTGLVVGHQGSGVDTFEYLSFYDIRKESKIDREALVKDLAEYTKQPKEEIERLVMIGQKKLRDEWNEKKPQTDEEIRKLYKETENYLYDLAYYHFTEKRQADLELVEALKKHKPKNVLDYGAGIGINTLMLAREGINVTIADLDSKSLDFALWRLKKDNLKHKVWKVDVDDKPPEEKYDIIVLYDILEHLSVKECKKVVDKLIKLKHKDTEIIMSTSFLKSKEHPMHYNINEEYKDLIDKLLRKE